jgi:hypothetical protein
VSDEAMSVVTPQLLAQHKHDPLHNGDDPENQYCSSDDQDHTDISQRCMSTTSANPTLVMDSWFNCVDDGAGKVLVPSFPPVSHLLHGRRSPTFLQA